MSFDAEAVPIDAFWNKLASKAVGAAALGKN
jgi:hypothetical protein